MFARRGVRPAWHLPGYCSAIADSGDFGESPAALETAEMLNARRIDLAGLAVTGIKLAGAVA